MEINDAELREILDWHERAIYGLFEGTNLLPFRVTVRNKGDIVGRTTTFQYVFFNCEHTSVECVLEDYFTGQWQNDIGILNMNGDNASEAAYGLSRKANELIVQAMSKAVISVGDYSSVLPDKDIENALETIKAMAADDGRYYGVVGLGQWNEIGRQIGVIGDSVDTSMPRKWKGIWWFLNTSLNEHNGGIDCYLYHGGAVGFAYGRAVSSSASKLDGRWFVNNSLPMGATIINPSGIVELCLKKN